MGIGTPLTSFSLKFTSSGTFSFICIVHGMQMTGKIVVVDPSVPVLSPEKVAKIAQNQIKDGMASAQTVIAQANASVPAPVQNLNGTTSYTVMMGYSSGVVDLMSFFPASLNVHPGDQVTWQFSPSNMAPHTVTVLNGTTEPALFLPYGTDPNAPPTLYFNPAVLAPSNWNTPLTNQGFVNSGLMIPGVYDKTAPIVIGNYTGTLPYFCILHDDAGMSAVLNISPR
jgi:plastocyanin